MAEHATERSTTQQWVLDPALIPIAEPPTITVTHSILSLTREAFEAGAAFGWTLDDWTDPQFEVKVQAAYDRWMRER